MVLKRRKALEITLVTQFSPSPRQVDGNRFKKERTVKLMVDTPYRVDVSFKPTQTLT